MCSQRSCPGAVTMDLLPCQNPGGCELSAGLGFGGHPRRWLFAHEGGSQPLPGIWQSLVPEGHWPLWGLPPPTGTWGLCVSTGGRTHSRWRLELRGRHSRSVAASLCPAHAGATWDRWPREREGQGRPAHAWAPCWPAADEGAGPQPRGTTAARERGARWLLCRTRGMRPTWTSVP